MWPIILFICSGLMFEEGSAVVQKLKRDESGNEFLSGVETGHSRLSREIGGTGFIPEQPEPRSVNVNTTEMKNGNASVDPTVMIDLNLIKLGDSYYHFATEKVNYFKAIEFCKKHNMDLLSIESKAENDLIYSVLKNLTAVDHVWTSGTDLHEEGKYIWLATGQRFLFTHWQHRQPDNFLVAEDCVEILKLDEGNYAWNDSWCTYKFNFVCEVSRCFKFCLR